MYIILDSIKSCIQTGDMKQIVKFHIWLDEIKGHNQEMG